MTFPKEAVARAINEYIERGHPDHVARRLAKTRGFRCVEERRTTTNRVWKYRVTWWDVGGELNVTLHADTHSARLECDCLRARGFVEDENSLKLPACMPSFAPSNLFLKQDHKDCEP